MKRISPIQIGLIALATIAVILGFILTEVMTYKANQKNNQANLTQRQLSQMAPTLLKESVDNLFKAQQLEIKNQETINTAGCTNITVYTGKYKGNEQYATYDQSFENNAPIKELCPSQQETYLSLFETEHYWDGDTLYTKPKAAQSYTKAEKSENSLVEKPTTYLSRYFSAYNSELDIKTVTQEGNSIIITAQTKTGKDTDQEDKYTIYINRDNKQITRLNYVKPSPSFTKQVGQINLAYSVKDVKPQEFMADQITPANLAKLLTEQETGYKLTTATTIITKNASTQTLETQYTDTKDSDQNKNDSCELRIRDCFNKYNQITQQIGQHLEKLSQPIKRGECKDLRTRTTAQIKNPNFLTITIDQKSGPSLSASIPEIEIETDITTGKTVVTQYTPSMTCYGSTINTAELKTNLSLFEQFTKVEL